jgi:hypothetical protein
VAYSDRPLPPSLLLALGWNINSFSRAVTPLFKNNFDFFFLYFGIKRGRKKVDVEEYFINKFVFLYYN